MILLPGIELRPQTRHCLLECLPRLAIEEKALQRLNTEVNITWTASPLQGIKIEHSNIHQIEKILAQVKASNVDRPAKIRLTGLMKYDVFPIFVIEIPNPLYPASIGQVQAAIVHLLRTRMHSSCSKALVHTISPTVVALISLDESPRKRLIFSNSSHGHGTVEVESRIVRA